MESVLYITLIYPQNVIQIKLFLIQNLLHDNIILIIKQPKKRFGGLYIFVALDTQL